MQGRRGAITVVLAIASVALAAFLIMGGSSVSSAPGTTQESDQGTEVDAGEAEGEARGGAAEAEEQARELAERTEAWQEAKANGTLRVNTAAAVAAPAAGWAGEQVLHPTADDWEPAIAADPNAPFVYLETTRYTGPTACGNKCPLPYIMLKVSSDGGVTWGPDRYICTC